MYMFLSLGYRCECTGVLGLCTICQISNIKNRCCTSGKKFGHHKRYNTERFSVTVSKGMTEY